jgi:4-hydroxy-tetrahydrodipicolinate reductase
MSQPRILINGSKGRMGQALIACAKEAGLPVVATIDQGDDLAAAIPSCDIIVDFSHHSVTAGVIDLSIRHGKSLVVGTTGHSTDERNKLAARASAAIPTVWASNYSVGVNVLFHLVAEAARVLDDSFDAEVVEMHHRFKKDAPSGTAGTLLDILMRARDLQESDLRHGRHGIVGERTKREIGVHALRGGDVVGDTHGHLRRPRRARGAQPQGRRPRHPRARRVACRPLGVRQARRPLRHAGRPRPPQDRRQMIASLRGTLLSTTPLHAVVEVAGVGYEVNVPLTTAEKLPAAGQPAFLHTHVVYREDSQAIYGFATSAERDFFRLLIEKSAASARRSRSP